MNEYIIKNYFLCIGKSYYKSADFLRLNANWSDFVKPTLQFGIGILSAFMIADMINVTIRYYNDNKILSFTITGPTEHFYYCKPNNIIKEQIGNHGTLIKMYLNHKYENLVNALNIEKMPIILMNNSEKNMRDYGDINDIKYNLLYILSRHIGVTINNINVNVELEDRTILPIYEHNTVFDYRKYNGVTTDDVEKIWKEYIYLDQNDRPYKLAIDNRDYIEDYVIHCSSENVEIYLPISLPKKGIKSSDIRIMDYEKFICNSKCEVLVDGIITSSDYNIGNKIDLECEIVDKAIINFIGKKRPVLSVDRKTIISMPSLREEYDRIREQLIVQIKNVVLRHIKTYKIANIDLEWVFILDYIIRKYPYISSEIINMIHGELKEWMLYEDEYLKKSNVKIQNIFDDDNICIENTNFRKYREISRNIIFRKAIGADRIIVDNDNVYIQGGELYNLLPFDDRMYTDDVTSLSSFIIRADEWNGKYEDYDIVTGIWPIVPDYLFDQYRTEYSNATNGLRYKLIERISNGLQGIANLDPVLINPTIGISIKRNDGLARKRNMVGKMESIQHDYYIHEFPGSEKYYYNNVYILYVYISPRVLGPDELVTLTEYEKKEPEYVKGVREGYSILFVGGSEPEYYISAGIVHRSEMIKLIPDSVKNKNKGKTIRFLDGTIVFEL